MIYGELSAEFTALSKRTSILVNPAWIQKLLGYQKYLDELMAKNASDEALVKRVYARVISDLGYSQNDAKQIALLEQTLGLIHSVAAGHRIDPSEPLSPQITPDLQLLRDRLKSAERELKAWALDRSFGDFRPRSNSLAEALQQVQALQILVAVEERNSADGN